MTKFVVNGGQKNITKIIQLLSRGHGGSGIT